MFTLIPWTEDLNLDKFYSEAARRGFDNNSSQKKMIDCLRNENEWAAWILYQGDNAIGSVAAHSFDNVMGPNSYRICVRTCSFSEGLPIKGLNKRYFTEYQNVPAQLYIPHCINWAGSDKNLYITTNDSKVGSQRLVHNRYLPTLEKLGVASRIKDIHYRGTDQTVWQLYSEKFLAELNKYNRWN